MTDQDPNFGSPPPSDGLPAPTPIPGPDDLVYVGAYARAAQAPGLQMAILQYLQGAVTSGPQGGPYAPPFPSTHGPKNAWDLAPWSGDEPAAEWLIGDLGPNQRRVAACLVAGGANGVWTSELRRIAGYDTSTSMSGVFKAIGGRCRAAGHRPFWNGGEKDSHKGQRLTVLDEQARALFAKVIMAKHPDLVVEFGIT